MKRISIIITIEMFLIKRINFSKVINMMALIGWGGVDSGHSDMRKDCLVKL